MVTSSNHTFNWAIKHEITHAPNTHTHTCPYLYLYGVMLIVLMCICVKFPNGKFIELIQMHISFVFPCRKYQIRMQLVADVWEAFKMMYYIFICLAVISHSHVPTVIWIHFISNECARCALYDCSDALNWKHRL